MKNNDSKNRPSRHRHLCHIPDLGAFLHYHGNQWSWWCTHRLMPLPDKSPNPRSICQFFFRLIVTNAWIKYQYQLIFNKIYQEMHPVSIGSLGPDLWSLNIFDKYTCKYVYKLVSYFTFLFTTNILLSLIDLFFQRAIYVTVIWQATFNWNTTRWPDKTVNENKTYIHWISNGKINRV